MQTAKRLYFYIIAFFSLEVILLGTIKAVRAGLNSIPGGDLQNLAQGLGMVAAALPIFLLHWLGIQRDASRQVEHRSTRLRAFFLYGVRFITLFNTVQSLISLLERIAAQLLREPAILIYFSKGLTPADYLVSISFNLIAWNFFERTLKKDWQSAASTETLSEMQKLFRYPWLLYSLGVLVTGIYQIINFVLQIPAGIELVPMRQLASGVSLLIVGSLVWAYVWQLIQIDIHRKEQPAQVNEAIFFVLTFSGATVSLFSAVVLIERLLCWLFGEQTTVPHFLAGIAPAFALLLPFAFIWSLHSRVLLNLISTKEEAARQTTRWIYDYGHAFLGLAAVAVGLFFLAGTLSELLFGRLVEPALLRGPLAKGLACLITGLPLWVMIWLRLENETQQPDLEGSPARRLLLRRVYLTLFLGASVIGGTASLWLLFQELFLGFFNTGEPLWSVLTARLLTLAVCLAFGLYHFSVMRRDNQLEQKSLNQQHARSPVLVIGSSTEDRFAKNFEHSLQHRAPIIPCIVHYLGQDAFNDLGEIRICVLPLHIALNPPEALQVWLHDFAGQIVMVPLHSPQEKVMKQQQSLLIGDTRPPLRLTVEETVRTVCRLAEGAPNIPGRWPGGWTLVAYFMAIVFGLGLLLTAVSALISQLS